MKNKKVDTLIINTDLAIKTAIITDLKEKSWEKITDNKYEGFGFFIEFLENYNKKTTMIFIYAIDQWNNIITTKNIIYGFFIKIGLKGLIKRIIKIIININKDAYVKHFFTEVQEGLS